MTTKRSKGSQSHVVADRLSISLSQWTIENRDQVTTRSAIGAYADSERVAHAGSATACVPHQDPRVPLAVLRRRSATDDVLAASAAAG